MNFFLSFYCSKPEYYFRIIQIHSSTGVGGVAFSDFVRQDCFSLDMKPQPARGRKKEPGLCTKTNKEKEKNNSEFNIKQHTFCFVTENVMQFVNLVWPVIQEMNVCLTNIFCSRAKIKSGFDFKLIY